MLWFQGLTFCSFAANHPFNGLSKLRKQQKSLENSDQQSLFYSLGKQTGRREREREYALHVIVM